MVIIESSITFPFSWLRVGKNWTILRQKEEFSSLRLPPPLLHPLFVNMMARLVEVMNIWLSLSPCFVYFEGISIFPFSFPTPQSSHSRTDQLFINAHACPIWLLPACMLLTFLHFSSGSICFLLFNTNKTFVPYTPQALMSLDLPLRFHSPRMPGKAPRQCLSIIMVWQRRPQVWERYCKRSYWARSNEGSLRSPIFTSATFKWFHSAAHILIWNFPIFCTKMWRSMNNISVCTLTKKMAGKFQLYWGVWNWYLILGTRLQPNSKKNKSMLPVTVDFFQLGPTQRHISSLRGNTGACGSLQSRSRGIWKHR